MIKLFHNLSRKQKGVATLIFAAVLMITATLIVMLTADQMRVQEKIVTNQERAQEAFQAAEAGLDYAVVYLNQNRTAILANNSGGYLTSYSNANTTNVVLANNSKYSFTYANPVANNYSLITITSIGTSSDGSVSRTVKQNVYFNSYLQNPPTTSLITKGLLSMSGSAQITNTTNNQTILAGGAVTLSGSSSTVVNGTGSSPGNIRSDIQANNTTLANESQDNFFATLFGATPTIIENNVNTLYTANTDSNYSASLNGVTGSSIWIEQTSGATTINGNTTIGSTAAPVLLIIDGNLNLKGNLTFYGFIFVLGTTTTDVLGNVTIYGGIAAGGNANITGSTNIIYNSSVLSTLKNENSMSYFAKVPGSWSDF